MRKRNTFIFLFILGAFVFGLWLNGFAGRVSSPQKEMILSEASHGNTQNSRYDATATKSSIESIQNASDIDNLHFVRHMSANDFNGIEFTPWDVAAASAHISEQDKKAYTIMVYMNGSDLESESGAATDDLIEMLDSGVNTDMVNIILFTGGTNRWQNDVIPENNCMIWRITDGGLEEITGVGLVNMGNSGTLASFIDFSMKTFPADKYGLILWDHGGGSIAGYGHDEKFNESNLMLMDLNYAFRMSELSKNKLEFLGFDSCLMATVEMAVVASDYADYLIASEDLEPGEGWNYHFLSMLNHEPSMNGAALGKAVVDYFMEYYGANSDEFLTLSVIDLSSVNEVMGAIGNLMSKCSFEENDRTMSFATFARKRSGTKTFGGSSPRDNECDMVDIGDMARKLSDMFPDEAEKVLSALEKSVVYNRHNSDIDLKGLSTYYIYAGKDTADVSLPTYASLKMDDNYTGYLYGFANLLNAQRRPFRNTRSRSSGQNDSGSTALPSKEDWIGVDLTVWQPVKESDKAAGGGQQGLFIMTGLQSGVDLDPTMGWTVDQEVLWPKINEQYVCLFEINGQGDRSLRAIPAVLNGRDCDIIVLFSERQPDGKILGVRQEDGFIIQKGLDPIRDGDKLSFYYRERYFGTDKEEQDSKWHKGDEFTVKGELKLDWSKRKDETHYSLCVTDVWLNAHYTGLLY